MSDDIVSLFVDENQDLSDQIDDLIISNPWIEYFHMRIGPAERGINFRGRLKTPCWVSVFSGDASDERMALEQIIQGIRENIEQYTNEVLNQTKETNSQ